jgi:hypothetical protein
MMIGLFSKHGGCLTLIRANTSLIECDISPLRRKDVKFRKEMQINLCVSLRLSAFAVKKGNTQFFNERSEAQRRHIPSTLAFLVQHSVLCQ